MNEIKAGLFGIAAVCALVVAGPAHADGLKWRGEVDDTATIAVHKHAVKIDANMNGVKNERHDFRGELGRGVGSVRLTHVRGRGRVWIAEQPSPRNHFTAVVRIKDNDAGAGKYEFELEW